MGDAFKKPYRASRERTVPRMGEGLALADAASRNGRRRSILDAIEPLSVRSQASRLSRARTNLPHPRLSRLSPIQGTDHFHSARYKFEHGRRRDCAAVFAWGAANGLGIR
jgi:hypothetical protein